MTNSILGSTKKLLGIDDAYDIFDPDIIMHINSVFLILNQIGVGPSQCFTIYDENTTWDDFFKDKEILEMVKTYMYLKVKLIFDPPLSSTALESMKQIISELEWRLSVQVDPEEE